MASRFALLATFLAAVGVVTWDEIKRMQRVPHPEKYVHAAVVWAILGIVADLGAPEIAALFGFGMVLSMLYRFYATRSSEQTGDVSPGGVLGRTAGDVLSN